MTTHEEGRAVPLHAAPEEAHAYLTKLMKLCGYMEPVYLGVIAAADMPKRMGVSDNPDGFLRISIGQAPLIILSDGLLDGQRWRYIIAHEFLHLFRWPGDEYALRLLPDHELENYMAQVELTTNPLTIFLMAGAMLNDVWEEGV